MNKIKDFFGTLVIYSFLLGPYLMFASIFYGAFCLAGLFVMAFPVLYIFDVHSSVMAFAENSPRTLTTAALIIGIPICYAVIPRGKTEESEQQ